MKQALLVIDIQNDYFINGKLPLVKVDEALSQTIKLQHFFVNRKILFFIFNILKLIRRLIFLLLVVMGLNFTQHCWQERQIMSRLSSNITQIVFI